MAKHFKNDRHPSDARIYAKKIHSTPVFTLNIVDYSQPNPKLEEPTMALSDAIRPVKSYV